MKQVALSKDRSTYPELKVIKPYETGSYGFSLTENNLLNYIIGNPKFEQYIKELMETIVYTNYLNSLSGSINRIDNPFDSIYLADLKPDNVHLKINHQIHSLASKIEDRSFMIIINDGLDD